MGAGLGGHVDVGVSLTKPRTVRVGDHPLEGDALRALVELTDDAGDESHLRILIFLWVARIVHPPLRAYTCA